MTGRTGRPRKPTEQKRRTGNPGKRKIAAPTELVAVPQLEPDPVDLPPAETLAAVLAAGQAWLAASDTTAVAMLRESLEERAALRTVVMEFGSADLRRALRDLDRQIIVMLSQLGFDPAGRARLGVAEMRARTTFEKLKEQQGRGRK